MVEGGIGEVVDSEQEQAEFTQELHDGGGVHWRLSVRHGEHGKRRFGEGVAASLQLAVGVDLPAIGKLQTCRHSNQQVANLPPHVSRARVTQVLKRLNKVPTSNEFV